MTMRSRGNSRAKRASESPKMEVGRRELAPSRRPTPWMPVVGVEGVGLVVKGAIEPLAHRGEPS